MKYAICKQDSTLEIDEEIGLGVEDGWVYKVVEDDGGDIVTVVEEIAGVGVFKIKALRSDLCEITEEEYKIVEEDEDGKIGHLLEQWIQRNWKLTP